MNTKWKCTTAIALALTMLAGRGLAQDEAAPSPEDFAKIMAAAAKPGPEHAKLKPLAGSWTYTCKFWMDPSKDPVVTTGTIERKWILGGRFLEERVSGTGFDGKPGFEGLGLIGYDNGRKKYTATWACTMSTGVSAASGVAEPSGGFTFKTECFCPVEKKAVTGRDVLRFETQDRTVAESYINHNGKEVKIMEIVAVRK